MKKYCFFLFTLIYLSNCNSNHTNTNNQTETKKTPDDVPLIEYTIAGRLPHDINSFTEGLLFHNNQLFESTGAPEDMPQTKSLFGTVDLQTGKIDKKVELDRNTYFGEGILFIKDKVYQLTYKNQICFVYDAKTYKKTGQFQYQNKEGWGMTTDGTHIIMSDGTDKLTYFEPDNFQVVKTLSVTSNNYAVDNLNELEYIKGYIYANIWSTDKIVKIDPATGHVVGKIDLTPLKEESLTKNPKSLETNGIAYDSLTDKIYVTGKMWPVLYQINFAH